MPGLTPASAVTSSASPSRSRASSVEKASPTIGETSRCAAGKRGSLGCARHEEVNSNARRSPPLRRGRAKLLNILDLDGLAGDALRQRRGHEPVEVAVKHVGRRGRRHAGPEVFYQLIGLQDVRADLVPPTYVGLGRIGRIG